VDQYIAKTTVVNTRPKLSTLCLITFFTSALIALIVLFVLPFVEGNAIGFFGTKYSTSDYFIYPLIGAFFLTPLYFFEVAAAAVIGFITLYLMKISKKWIVIGPVLAMLFYAAFWLYGDLILILFIKDTTEDFLIYKILGSGALFGTLIWALTYMLGNNFRK
jgi:hypothetical protein